MRARTQMEGAGTPGMTSLSAGVVFLLGLILLAPGPVAAREPGMSRPWSHERTWFVEVGRTRQVWLG
jgi:hypothetical protein